MSFGTVLLPVPWSKKGNTQDIFDKLKAGLTTHNILFEIITFYIRKPLPHVTAITEKSGKIQRGILFSKETVTVMQINSKDP